MYPLNDAFMGRNWLNDSMEDKDTPDFERSILPPECHLSLEKPARVREPQRS